MPSLEFAIESTVPDNTSFTVLTALRELGYQELERVERVDLLRLRLQDGAMSTEECGRALMRAEVVFNPNKHRLTHAGANGASGGFEAVVADKDDDATGLRDLLGGRFGILGLEQVERAVAWRLHERNGPAGKDRLDWACRELLANPYSQTYAIRTRPKYDAVK